MRCNFTFEINDGPGLRALFENIDRYHAKICDAITALVRTIGVYGAKGE